MAAAACVLCAAAAWPHSWHSVWLKSHCLLLFAAFLTVRSRETALVTVATQSSAVPETWSVPGPFLPVETDMRGYQTWDSIAVRCNVMFGLFWDHAVMSHLFSFFLFFCLVLQTTPIISIGSAVLTTVPMLFWGSTLSGSRQRLGALPRSAVPEHTQIHTLWIFTDGIQAGVTEVREFPRWPGAGGLGASSWPQVIVSEWQGPHTDQTALRNDRNPLSDPPS